MARAFAAPFKTTSTFRLGPVAGRLPGRELIEQYRPGSSSSTAFLSTSAFAAIRSGHPIRDIQETEQFEARVRHWPVTTHTPALIEHDHQPVWAGCGYNRIGASAQPRSLPAGSLERPDRGELRRSNRGRARPGCAGNKQVSISLNSGKRGAIGRNGVSGDQPTADGTQN